nr:MAG TPA: Protein of unknown function (DUF3788) [Caudoviricetes sp.]
MALARIIHFKHNKKALCSLTRVEGFFCVHIVHRK